MRGEIKLDRRGQVSLTATDAISAMPIAHTKALASPRIQLNTGTSVAGKPNSAL